MFSAITLSLLPSLRGPFVFTGDPASNCGRIAEMGFDAVELVPPSAEALDAAEWGALLAQHCLKLAAIDSSAGWFQQGLSLTHPEAAVRARARDFIQRLIDLAATFEAPVIIGSMQGGSLNGAADGEARPRLRDALEELAPRAAAAGVPLLFEPLNRYETDLIHSMSDATAFLDSLLTKDVKLCCNLFHMNMEETSLADALGIAASHVGYIHLADSNRLAPGLGHAPWTVVGEALQEIGFVGYLSVAALPHPSADTAAEVAMTTFRKYIQLPMFEYPV